MAVDERWVRKALRASAVWPGSEEGGVEVVGGGSDEGVEAVSVMEEDMLELGRVGDVALRGEGHRGMWKCSA